jgi:hypothetical protein
MRLAADQTHETAAAAAKMQRLLGQFVELDLFHAIDRMPLSGAINSVSLQPISGQTAISD